MKGKLTENEQELFTKSITGEASAADKQALDALLTDSAKQSAYEQMKATWELFGGEEQTVFDPTEAITKLQQPKKSKKIRLYVSYAAAAVILFFAVFSILKNDKAEIRPEIAESTSSEEIITTELTDIYIAREVSKETKLADGSIVNIQPNSSLTVTQIDNSKRQVQLIGTAFFNISKSGTSFLINVLDKDSLVCSKVRVYGTQFWVEAPLDSDSIYCRVKEGLVSFHNAENDSVMLHGGQEAFLLKTDKNAPVLVEQIILEKEAPEEIDDIVEIDVENIVLKKKETASLRFMQTPLNEVVVQLNDVSGVEIEITSEKIKNIPVTANFREQTLRSALQTIKLILEPYECSIEKQNHKYILKEKTQ